MQLWDTRTLELLKTYKTERPINAAAISPLLDHVSHTTHPLTPAANEPDSNGKFEEASTPPDTLQKGDSVSEVGGHLTIECQPFITVSPIVYNNLAMVNRHYHQEVFCIRYHSLGPTPHSLSPSGQELFLPRVV